jgi:hypothetical protein
MATWLFQGNPEKYLVRQALQYFRAQSQLNVWEINQHKKKIKAGDEVFFWQAGRDAALVGWGTIETGPTMIGLEPQELPFTVDRARFEGSKLRVRVRVEGVCYRKRSELKANPAFRGYYPIAHGAQRTNLRVPEEVAAELRGIVKGQDFTEREAASP